MDVSEITHLQPPRARYIAARAAMESNPRSPDWFELNRVREAALAAMVPAEIRAEGDEARGRGIKVRTYSLRLEDLGL